MTSSTRPIPHSGGVRHSAGAVEVGTAVRQPVPCRAAAGRCRGGSSGRRGRRRRLGPVCSVGVWHDAQPTPRTARRRPDVAVVGVAHRRHGQRAAVERHRGRAARRSSRDRRRLSPPRTPSCAAGSSGRGAASDVMPMSPWKAPATCCSTVATFAFHPKRPSAVAPARSSHTWLGRPEMPSPSSSSGSAASRMSASGIASSRPGADDLRGEPGRDHIVVAERPERRVVDVYVGVAQRVRRAVAVRAGDARTSTTTRPSAGRRGRRGPGAGRRRPGCGAGPPVCASRRAPKAAGAARARRVVAGGSGGAPRPSRMWHDEHDWAFKIGPRPSRASVDAGAVTQFRVKKLSPTSNSRRSSSLRLRGREGESVPRRLVAGRRRRRGGVEARRRRRRRQEATTPRAPRQPSGPATRLGASARRR